MTIAKPDWRGVIKLEPVKSGPEDYAPPHQRAAKAEADVDEIESVFRQHDLPDTTTDGTTELNKLIERAAGASMDEIDRVIRELESLRGHLRDEGERVTREIAGFANLSRASKTAMQVIADTIQKSKGARDDPS
jgi:hypothetical protein